MFYSCTVHTLLGLITIYEKDGKLFKLEIGTDCGKAAPKTPLIIQAALQLQEYFNGKRKEFQLPLAPEGTAFQQAVWKALLDIPYGQTRSYGQIAQNIGNPRASRAVGMANHNNPIGIIIPCHRVIGANGDLVGYAGGMDIKMQLLDLEKRYK
jgi:methylated-DNA-[protein]-cysteine S-methyltransferase